MIFGYGGVLLFLSALAPAEPAQDPYALYEMGFKARAANRLADAGEYFRAVLNSSDELAPFAQVRLAEIHSALHPGNGETEILWRRALQNSTDNAAYMSGTVQYADWLWNQGRNAEAASQYEHVLEAFPALRFLEDVRWRYAEALLGTGEANAQQKAYALYRNWAQQRTYTPYRRDAARRLLKSSAEQDRVIGAFALLHSGEMDEMRAQLQEWKSATGPNPAEAVLPSWVRYIDTAYEVRRQAGAKQYLEAITLAKRLLDEFPGGVESEEVVFWLGDYLVRNGRNDLAAQILEVLLEKRPNTGMKSKVLETRTRIALTKNDADGAAAQLDALRSHAPGVQSLPELAYTLGTLYERTGKKKAAQVWMACAAGGPLGDYYVHRAAASLHATASPENRTAWTVHPLPIPLAVPTFVHTRSLSAATLPPVTEKRLRFWAKHSAPERDWEAISFLRGVGRPPWDEATFARIMALAELGYATRVQDFYYTDGWKKSLSSADAALLEFPRAYWDVVSKAAAEQEVDPYLVLAVMRQESAFNPGVVSRSGAVGLLQVMPATAKHVVKRTAYFGDEMTDELHLPEHNVRLGAKYLKDMLQMADGSYIGAIASYNAGPGNFQKWQRKYALSRGEDFVDHIPYQETRDYVRKVLTNYAVYQSLYKGAASTTHAEQFAASEKTPH